MTREEALKAWEKMYSEIDKENYLFVGTINPQMVEWAIKALGGKQDGDLISRQSAIDTLNKLDVSDGVGISSIACSVQESAISAIQHLPSAQPEQQWVPCSERLPEEDTKVLISYCYKEGEGDTDHVNIDITSYGTTCFGGREIHTLKEWRQPFDYFHANYEVIAWMPLPEPYREDDDERPD